MLVVTGLVIAGICLALWQSPSGESPAIRVESQPPHSEVQTLPTGQPGSGGDKVGRSLRPPISGRLRVTTSDGAAIPFATVVTGDDHSRTLGKTDDHGLFVIEHATVGVDALVVSADGYFSSIVPETEVNQAVQRGSEISVQLETAFTIAGRLVRQTGTPAPSGVWVLAWGSAAPPSITDIEALIRSASAVQGGAADDLGGIPTGSEPRDRVLLTRTSSLGSFAFEDKVPFDRYTIVAGGEGVVSRRRAVITPGPDVELEVPVVSHFALGLLLQSDSGGPLRPPRVRPFGTTSTHAFAEGDGVELRAQRPIERTLLGLTPSMANGIEQSHLIELVARSPRQFVGPVTLNALHPGYRKHSVRQPIPSSRHGLEFVTVTLQPSGELVGSLEVTLDGASRELESVDPEAHPDAELKLTRLDGETLEIWFSLAEVKQDRVTVAGITAGTWTGSLELGDGLATLQSVEQRVTVGPDAMRSALTFDVSRLASLDVDVFDQHDQPFGGEVYLSVRRLDAIGTGGFRFPARPYRVGFLEPGSYQVDMLFATTGETIRRTARSAPIVVHRETTEAIRLKFGEVGQ